MLIEIIMETPKDYLSQDKIERINLADNETAYFNGEIYQIGLDPKYDYPYAKAEKQRIN